MKRLGGTGKSHAINYFALNVAVHFHEKDVSCSNDKDCSIKNIRRDIVHSLVCDSAVQELLSALVKAKGGGEHPGRRQKQG